MLTIRCNCLSKREENLHKHTHAAILPTDAFNHKLQISAQKGASPCAGKHSSTSSKKNVLKAFLISGCIQVNKPVNCQLCIKGKQKRYFVQSL